jgi:hypothetical protein
MKDAENKWYVEDVIEQTQMVDNIFGNAWNDIEEVDYSSHAPVDGKQPEKRIVPCFFYEHDDQWHEVSDNSGD